MRKTEDGDRVYTENAKDAEALRNLLWVAFQLESLLPYLLPLGSPMLTDLRKTLEPFREVNPLEPGA